jgi:hypothetical protein
VRRGARGGGVISVFSCLSDVGWLRVGAIDPRPESRNGAGKGMAQRRCMQTDLTVGGVRMGLRSGVMDGE